jgi:hypothetical protein
MQYLVEPVTGFWYHGWEFNVPQTDPLVKGHNFVKAPWARGNAWITLSFPLFIEITQLPPSDPLYRMIVSTLERQVDSLVATQDETTGLWHTLLVDPTSYVETSASSGFAVGILMAIKLVCPVCLYGANPDADVRRACSRARNTSHARRKRFKVSLPRSRRMARSTMYLSEQVLTAGLCNITKMFQSLPCLTDRHSPYGLWWSGSVHADGQAERLRETNASMKNNNSANALAHDVCV